MPPSPSILARAREAGFSLCGIASAEPSARQDYWRTWIARGLHGDMHYLADRLEERLNPALYLPGARSAICLAINYHVPLASDPTRATPQVPGRIARYALPDDYHDWIKQKLYDLADFIRETFPGPANNPTRTRCGVDTAPIPERELAARAGLGFIGKNTCLISPRLGSFLFLGTVLTTLDLPPTPPEESGVRSPDIGCGTCTRCLDACPTAALSPDRPYQLDASRCISYLTIEYQGQHQSRPNAATAAATTDPNSPTPPTSLPDSLTAAIGDWLYGCDICQDVCPFNAATPTRPGPPTATDPRLQPRHPTGTIDAAAVLHWTDAEWHPFSRRSALRRLGLPLFKRNAETVLRNHAAKNPANAAEDAR